jgi:hypothetical protein
MGVLAQFPAKVISQPEVGPTLAREITTQDLQNLGEDLMGLLTLLYENTAFAIVSGVNYLGGYSYSSGMVILNGTPYYFPGGLLLNKYLIPDDDSVELSITGVYNDDNTYPIYRMYSVQINNTAISGSSPQFLDNMSQYKTNLNQLKNALKTTFVNTLSVIFITDTTIIGGQSDATMVNGTIIGSSHSIEYDYIIGNNNIVMFDVLINSSSWIFNINDKTGALITSRNGGGSGNIKTLLINTGGEWVEITGFNDVITTINGEITTINGNISTNTRNISTNTSDISTINGEITTINGNISTNTSNISTINGEIITINSSLLTKGTPVASFGTEGVDIVITNLFNLDNYVIYPFPSRVPSTAKFVLFRAYLYTVDLSTKVYLHAYSDTTSYADGVITGIGHESITETTNDIWISYDSNGFKIKTVNLTTTDIIYLTVAGWM